MHAEKHGEQRRRPLTDQLRQLVEHIDMKLGAEDLDGTGAAVDGDQLAGPQAARCVAGANHRWDAILARDK